MSIDAKHLSVTIDGTKILDNLNFSCHPGQITAIAGENGAGKSTLINCLAGVCKLEGELTLNEQPIERLNLAELAQYRAVLPQQSNLNFPFSVDEVVRLAMSLTAISHEQQEAIITKCLEQVDASHFRRRNYLHLSGGEKQRVQLARVLAQLYAHNHSQSRFLFLDEPTSALDLKHQYATLKMLRELCTNNTIGDIGILVIVHDLNLASFYCDKIMLLDGGSLVAHDTPENVLQNDIIKNSFGIDVLIESHPNIGKPYLMPRVI